MEAQTYITYKFPEIPAGWMTFLKIMLLGIAGSLTYNIYPAALNVVALSFIIFTFYHSLRKHDFLSFLLLLFFSEHFPLALNIGGVYNLGAIIALGLFFLQNGTKSPLLKKGKYLPALIAFFIIQVFSVVSQGTFSNATKLNSVVIFFEILFLFYFCTRIVLSESNFIYFLKFIGIFTIYMFLVSLNQKYDFYQSTIAIFPTLDKSVEYEMNVTRSAGTLINFEAYSEYCLSVIALFLPGLFSGSFLKEGKKFYAFAMAVIVLAFLSIVLSGTRSSIILFPVLLLLTIFILGKRTSFKVVLAVIVFSSLFWVVNSRLKAFDFEVFLKRSEDLTSGHASLKGMLSGEEMNRGGIFKYASEKIERSNLLLGGGYYTSAKEYNYIHFDDKAAVIGEIPDYHNLYMSCLVVWGIFGLLIILYLFGYSTFKGIKLYYQIKKSNPFFADLVLGFSLLFLFFLINQFKIQFIREPSYFVLILILLAIFNSLIDYLKAKNGGKILNVIAN